MNRLRRGSLSLLVILLLLSGCSPPEEDEIVIRRLVSKAAGLAEQHDIGGIMELTTEDFLAFPGKLDRREARRILWMAFRHYGDLMVMYPQPKVDLESDPLVPSVSFPFLILKKDQSLPDLAKLYNDPGRWVESVGERADLYRFRLALVKVKGDWLVKGARLEKFTGLGFRE
ncbi:MAG: hypothetical protein JW821_11955 [Deltaproteobacteria bacterium]|nr:hypothetical protein [Deltaproteobacteria bacterium]